MPNEQFFALGEILKPRGVMGELKVYSYTEIRCMSYYCTLKSVWVGKTANKIIEYEVVKSRIFKLFFLFCLKGIDTVEKADTLRHNFIYIPEELRADLAENEILIDDLLGSVVFNTKGVKLGKVVNFFNNGANGICEVVGLNKTNFLFPVTNEVLIEVQRKQKRLIIDPLEQML